MIPAIHQEINLPAIASRSLVPEAHEMQVFYTIAEAAVESKFYRGIGDKAAVMMIMLAARELNIPPMMALNKGINNIQGSLEISARLMNALMRRAGLSIQTLESTDSKCTIKGTRPNGDTETVTYTIKDAQLAGLVKPTGGWVKNPTDMCYSRAISRLARRLAPDIIGGCYVEGEVSDAMATSSALTAQSPLESNIIPEIELGDWITKYLKLFRSEDRIDAMAFYDEVKNHFEWDEITACKELTKDGEKTLTKFDLWKRKNGVKTLPQ